MNAEVRATAAPDARRAGGLLVPARGCLHPSFALFLFFLTVDVTALLFAPYFASRWTDSPWGSVTRLAFLGQAIAGGLAFGLVASISAERRNRSPWWFLSGHLGVVAALFMAIAGRDLSDGAGPRIASIVVVAVGFLGAVVALFATSRPAPTSPAPDAALVAISRAMYAISNVKLGIVLMAIVAIATQFGSIHENRYNSKAAHFDVYRSWWFGATWFLSGISMLAATFRKWPWRFEQAGWLTVHAGLGLVVIGSMMSFFSSVEGELALREGETGKVMEMRNASRLVVEEIARREDGRRFRRPVLNVPVRFDADPTNQTPQETFRLALGEEGTATLVADRYYTASKPYEHWTDDGPEPVAALEFKLGTPDGEAETLRLDEKTRSSHEIPFGQRGFGIQFVRLTKPLYEAILREEDPAGYGKVVVRDAKGAVAAELAVAPASRPTKDDGATAKLSGAATVGDVGVELLDYADNAGTLPNSTEMFDLSPGTVRNPAVRVKFKRGGSEEIRLASVFRPPEQADLDGWLKSPFPFAALYDWQPRFKLEGPLLVFTPTEGGAIKWIYVGTDGKPVGGDVVFGAPLPLPIPMLLITPIKSFARARVEEGYDFDGYRDGAPETARLTLTKPDGAPETLWLRRGGGPGRFEVGGRMFEVAWAAERRPLGFELKLNDFHRDFYPGSTSERSFESYLELVHPEKFPKPADIKIDMNRPLRLDGWRLYQSRFGQDDATTFLQVNRDPGLAVIYPACCVVLVGLVVVSFMKKAMRERRAALETAGASPTRTVIEALLTVFAIGGAPLAYGLWVAADLPHGGAGGFLFGLFMVVLAPTAVVILYVRRFGGSQPVRAPESAS